MPSGEFIADRWLVGAIRRICEDRKITFRTFSHDWLLELRHDEQIKRIIGYKFPLNSSVAAQTAEDKVSAYLLLSDHDIPAVPHVLARTKITVYDDWKEQGWEKVVVKPLMGTSGYQVGLFEDHVSAIDWILKQPLDGWAVSPYLDIRSETRVIILQGKVLLAYEKQPVTVRGLKMFNLGLGATPKKIVDPDRQLIQLAINACQALDLQLAAVDIVELAPGERMVLEVNDGLMMEHYARMSDEYQQDAYTVYSNIIAALFE